MHNPITSVLTQSGPPDKLGNSRLWKRLAENSEYSHSILEIRKVASALGAKIPSAMPEYTDHSVEHMDSLWGVTDQVLTNEEIDKFSASEAFVLGAAFYLHDLGMASTVTAAGKDETRTTEPYKIALARFKRLNPTDQTRADVLALREATRDLHAGKAIDLAANPIPGLDRFLIEDTEFRQRWAYTIGQIAASHHWTMEEVERTLGISKITPGPDGQNLDLGFLASVLRVIDFAHIDRARAPKLERSLRPRIPKESQIHWDAQENITGPARVGDYLVYSCTQPISNIDAWWLFYDLASELDSEIRAVYEYLRNRASSTDRFSLKGVKAVENPSAFADYVKLVKGIVPVDIRVQPDSMERVVELLGGRHIYGSDQLAPIRELVQNARDAVGLRQALDRADGRTPSPGEIALTVRESVGEFILSIRDNGVGMTRSVVRKHLVGVGSDFWNSVEFYRDFRRAIDSGFRPIGKFGIGFLSVFMLGDHVEVETEALANNRLKLTLDGLGKRGELLETKPTGLIGTEVRVTLKDLGPLLAKNLPEIVRARAPMLTIPITVSIPKSGTLATERIDPGWWKRLSEEALTPFIQNWGSYSHVGKPASENPHSRALYRYAYSFPDGYTGPQVHVGGKWAVKGWPGAKPQYIDDSKRLLSQGGEPSFGVVACSQGIAVELLRVPDVIGLIELGPIELTASRESIAEDDSTPDQSTTESTRNRIPREIISALTPAVVARMDEIHTHGMLPGRISFVRGMATAFGNRILDLTKLSWIPVTLPPGDLVHYPKPKLAEALKSQTRVLLAIGISPGAAYGAASSHISSTELGRMMVISIGTEEISVSFSIQQNFEHEGLGGVLKGTLDHILKVIAEESQTRSPYEHRSVFELASNMVLTEFLLTCIAESWGMQTNDLRNQSWFLHYKDSALYGDLRRV